MQLESSPVSRYVGRFAPSPTGRLHIGSLFTAVASYLDARAHHGLWHVRIEDLDPLRNVAGAAADILRSLECYGLEWDGDVMYQQQRLDAYQAALNQLIAQARVYGCDCSRKMLTRLARKNTEGAPIYDGHCRGKAPEGALALRIQVPAHDYCFEDRVVGRYCQNLAKDVGDFVIRRADGVWAYQLAVVVDDAAIGVTHVVRGRDLLTSTTRQIYLQQCLKLSVPQYAHLPLLTNREGQKWSKQTHAPALNLAEKEAKLWRVLNYFDFSQPIERASCQHMLQQALEQWTSAKMNKNTICTENVTVCQSKLSKPAMN